eukprot:TRINITY_DN8616_c0_g2_i1.p1 TRINITY_DN8616_c0_g2~~TRINITY_DN8616_c0_g2_i1.p1  ORF type:complete len:537 (+),score=59.97 TRINITY_DN8616_c0_g2_i1:140-1750(+)
MFCKRSAYVFSLAISALIVVGQPTTDDGVEITAEQIMPQKSTREILQTLECDQLLINVPKNTGVQIEVEYINGNRQTSKQKGPDAQLLSLDMVQKITIIPDSKKESATVGTIILSSDEFSVHESASKQVDSATYQTANHTIMTIQQGITNNVTAIPMPISSTPHPAYLLKDSFSTVANVKVDNRQQESGVSIQTQASPLPNFASGAAMFQMPTFQRGLPSIQSSSLMLIPDVKSKIQSNSYSPQLDTQYATPKIEWQDLNVRQIPETDDYLEQQVKQLDYGYVYSKNQDGTQFVAPETEQKEIGVSAREITQIGANLQEQINLGEQRMEIMSFDHDNGIQFQDVGYGQDNQLATFKMSGLQPMNYENEQETVVVDHEEQACIPMAELIKKNECELFSLAMEVLDLQYESMGKIVSVFLPDPVAFEAYLKFVGVDLHTLSAATLQQQQVIRQLVQSHIVPNALLLNLSSIATHAGTPLNNLNQQVINIALQDTNFGDVIITPQNVEVVSTIPQMACEGFLFKLNSVLIPMEQFANSP